MKIDLWIHNHTPEDGDLIIIAELSAWDDAQRDYPNLEAVEVPVKAGEVRKISIRPVSWDLGTESYWWPNKPFDEDYSAVLHNLNLKLKEQDRMLDEKNKRFGVVELFVYQRD